jgi:N-terminal half of MaoC dehydratase
MQEPPSSVPGVNVAAEGKTYPPVRSEVTAERLAAFQAVFAQHGGTPPTFATTVEYEAFVQVLDDQELALDFAHVVHGSQEFTHARPMRAGEQLVATIRIESIKVKGANGFLTLVTDMVDADGDLVCTARSTMVERRP